MSITFNEKYVPKGTAEVTERLSGETRRGNSIYDRRVSRRGSIINPYASAPPPGTLVNSDRAYSTVAETLPDFPDLHDEHREQTEKEASMGFFQGLKTYPAAAAWSVLLSSSIIMEGYDTNLLGSLFAYPVFNEQYGKQLPNGFYEVEAKWQTAIMNAAQIGSFIGLGCNGILCDKLGYKKTYMIALAMMTVFIFPVFFSTTPLILMIGQLLSGVPWGMFQTLSVSYASEVCPVSLRGYLTTYANICWVLGQILSSGVLRGFLSNHTQWAFRIPFALQWVFIPPIAIGVIFAPESPWWLVRNGHDEKAAIVVKRLMSKNERLDENNVANKISEMKLTNEHEKALSAGTSYLDCFRGIDLRRTEVACLTWAVQNMSGSALMGFSTYFYKNAGLPTEQAFNLTLAQYSLGFFGTIGSWALMSYFGRRSLYISGIVAQGLIMAIIGGLGFAPANSTITTTKRSGGGSVAGGSTLAVNVGASWGVGSLLLVFTLVFDLTVGPICYAIVGESSSTRLRQKTIVLARMVYNICGVLNNIYTPLMLNPGAWGWGARSGLFWAGICVICFAWAFFRLPETGNRTYGELTILFENKVSARNFASTKVDQFRSQSVVVQQGGLSEEDVEKM